jgi:hypothetical protein
MRDSRAKGPGHAGTRKARGSEPARVSPVGEPMAFEPRGTDLDGAKLKLTAGAYGVLTARVGVPPGLTGAGARNPGPQPSGSRTASVPSHSREGSLEESPAARGSDACRRSQVGWNRSQFK